jgi:hypothetical protein
MFWKKLDFSPAFVEQEFDYQHQMGLINQEISSQSPAMRKSLVSKVMSVIFPSKSTKKPPKIQEDHRGRPTTKQQNKRGAAAAALSDLADTGFQGLSDQARSSCFAGTSDSMPKHRPRLRRSRSTAETQPAVPGFPLLREDVDVIHVMQFEGFIPQMFHPFVTSITNVEPNGHCGFAAVAVGLGHSEGGHYYVRTRMLQELDGPWSSWWRSCINHTEPEEYDRVRSALYFPYPLERADVEHWMWFPYAGLLVAQAFNVVVHLLTTAGSQTFFPVRNGPPLDPDGNYYAHAIVTVCHVNNNHFINVKLEGEYPVPVLNNFCRQWRTPEAAEWEAIYQHRIDEYIRIRDSMRPAERPTVFIDEFL